MCKFNKYPPGYISGCYDLKKLGKSSIPNRIKSNSFNKVF